MDKILLAGATGYLGTYILRELINSRIPVRVLVRSRSKLFSPLPATVEIAEAEITQPGSIKGSCENIEAVISTVGITRQKDGLTYMDVDYQANLNLLNEAKRGGVKKFIYVSVLHGDKLQYLKICAAKERFVDELKSSGLDYCIIRPTGFFSDMAAFFDMAKKGRVYLFGDGSAKMNPIHGADLGAAVVSAIAKKEKELNIGGPEVLTQNEIAATALKVLDKKIKITHLPDAVRKAILFTLRTFASSKTYGPIEFALTVISMDMIAPVYGVHTLEEYYSQLNAIKKHS